MRRGERRAEEDIIKLCSIKHGSQHLPNRSASHAAKGSSGGGDIMVLLSNRVKQINGCSHSGTKVKDPVRSTNTHMYAFSCNPNPNMRGASLLRIVRRQGRWRIVVRHPLVLQHAERLLNRLSARSGTQKGGWNREPNVLRMVPGRVSFWRHRPPKKGSSFRPPLSAPLLRKQTGDVKWPHFGGQKTAPCLEPKNQKSGSTKSQKTTALRFTFVVLINTMTLRQRAEYPANQTQQMSPFRRTELPKTNRHLCLGTPIHDTRQAKPSGLPGSRN